VGVADGTDRWDEALQEEGLTEVDRGVLLELNRSIQHRVVVASVTAPRRPRQGSSSKDLAWPALEGKCHGSEVLGGPPGQVGSSREVLAQQSVGVLVRRSLSGRARVGEEHLRAGVERELGVPGQLLAATPGKGLAQLIGKVRR